MTKHYRVQIYNTFSFASDAERNGQHNVVYERLASGASVCLLHLYDLKLRFVNSVPKKSRWFETELSWGVQTIVYKRDFCENQTWHWPKLYKYVRQRRPRDSYCTVHAITGNATVDQIVSGRDTYSSLRQPLGCGNSQAEVDRSRTGIQCRNCGRKNPLESRLPYKQICNACRVITHNFVVHVANRLTTISWS